MSVNSSTRDKERIKALRKKSAAAIRMARRINGRCKTTFVEMNDLLLASQINDVLHDIEPRVISELIDKEPERFFRLAAIINAQASEKTRREKAELELEKYRDHVEEQKRKIQNAARAGERKGLSPEILARIEEAANLL